ncbi:MAG: hypothetical protein D6723_08885 [Acidobacteria bacterium]|nr:MAG: hypothetical protein D6723_08885 [Acidobacteriota bacterium]
MQRCGSSGRDQTETSRRALGRFMMERLGWRIRSLESTLTSEDGHRFGVASGAEDRIALPTSLRLTLPLTNRNILRSMKRRFFSLRSTPSRFAELLALLLIVVSFWPGTILTGSETRPRAVILSLDGNAYWFMQTLLSRGRASTLQRVLAAYHFSSIHPCIPNFPSKTAPGHATLFTGTYAHIHGVTGNRVFVLPLEEHDLLKTTGGFDGTVLLVEPIWITAARQGIKTVVHQATHAFPMPVTGEKERRLISQFLTLVDGYGQSFGRDAVITFDELESVGDGRYALNVGQSRFFLRRGRGETLLISRTEDFRSPQSLGRGLARRISLTVQTPRGSMSCYLAWLDGSLDGKDLKLYHSRPSRRKSNHASLFAERSALPPFVPNGASRAYERGDLGRPLPLGGNGRAERLYLETLLAVVENAEAFSLWLQKKAGRGELEIYYLPIPDEPLHNWAGFLLPESPLYDPATAETYWRFMETLMDRIARFIDRVIFHGGRSVPDVFFLVTDHGMDYAIKDFHVNEALARKGFLTKRGRFIDLHRTAILYPPVEGFFLKVNARSYAQGMVSEKEKDQLLLRVERALLTLRDSTTGGLIVRNVWPARLWQEVGSGGPRGGELYLELQPGYYPTWRLQDGKIVTTREATASGVHGYWPFRRTMWGAFLIASSSVQYHIEGNIRQTQLVPTVAQLLNIRPSRRVTAPPLAR